MDITELIINTLEKRKQLKASDIVKTTGFSRVYVNRFLQKLRDEGRIILLGNANTARYILATEKSEELVYKYLHVPFYDYMQWYGFSNINSILLNSDFHGTKMKDVYFSNIKFGNCLNIDKCKYAIGCLFQNFVSSSLKDLRSFIKKGAEVNGKYNTNYNFIWKKTKYKSYINQLASSMTQGFISGLFYPNDQKQSPKDQNPSL